VGYRDVLEDQMHALRRQQSGCFEPVLDAANELRGPAAQFDVLIFNGHTKCIERGCTERIQRASRFFALVKLGASELGDPLRDTLRFLGMSQASECDAQRECENRLHELTSPTVPPAAAVLYRAACSNSSTKPVEESNGRARGSVRSAANAGPAGAICA